MKAMWLNTEEHQTVNSFWEQAGEVEPFPRSLERPIALALPVAVIKLPHLALGGIENWLRSRQIDYSFDCDSRFVRGCLIAYQGKGLIFCDGSDPEDEIRFTLAHEIGHFLSDYWFPRQRALNKLGNKILDVIDGLREPSVTERVHALLENIKIGMVSDLIERQNADETTWSTENKADRVGFALLAPPSNVISGVDLSVSDFPQRLKLIADRLVDQFGLPAGAAQSYANALLRAIGKGPSWVESIKSH
jgi:hypothetical protein